MISRLRRAVAGGAGEKRGFANIVRNTGWLLGSKGLGAVLSLVYLAIATRTMGPAGFGVFSLVIAIAQFIARIVTFDSWQAVVKFGQVPLRDEEKSSLARLVGATLTIDVLSAVAGIVLAAAIALLLGPVLGWNRQVAWMGLGYASVVLLATRSTAVGILRLLDRFAAAAFAESMMPITRMAGALLALWFNPTPLGFLMAWACSEVVVSTTYWILAFRYGRRHIGAVKPVGIGEARRHFPGILNFSVASNINLSLLALINNVPIFLVGMFAGTTGAGYYRLAAQLGNAMTTFSQLMSRAIFAESTRHHMRGGQEGDMTALRKLSRQISAAAALSAVLIILMLWLVGEWVLVKMSGAAYLPAYPLLLLLAGAAAIEMAGVSFDPILMTIDRQRLTVMVRLVECAILGALLVVLLPRMGAQGAALAVLVASVGGFVMRAAAVRRHLR